MKNIARAICQNIPSETENADFLSVLIDKLKIASFSPKQLMQLTNSNFAVRGVC